MPETAKLSAFLKLLIKSPVPWSQAAAWWFPVHGRGRQGTRLPQLPACPPAHTLATTLSPPPCAGCPVPSLRSCVLPGWRWLCGQCPAAAASPAGWVLSPVPFPPQGFLQCWGPCTDPASPGFVDEAGVSVGWPGDCMGRCDRSCAWFSPEALLLHMGLLCSVMVSFLGAHKSGWSTRGHLPL